MNSRAFPEIHRLLITRFTMGRIASTIGGIEESAEITAKKMPARYHSYSHTREALQQLQNRLICAKCKLFVKKPYSLGSCEHIFCRECCEYHLGEECPVCGIPVHVKDAHVNRQIHNLAQLCERLQSILDDDNIGDEEEAKSKDKGLEDKDCEKYNKENAEESNQATISCASFTTCKDRNIFDLNLNNTTNTPIRNLPSETPKMRSRTPKTGSRENVPINQSTMTQHFDVFDLENESFVDSNDGQNEALAETAIKKYPKKNGAKKRNLIEPEPSRKPNCRARNLKRNSTGTVQELQKESEPDSSSVKKKSRSLDSNSVSKKNDKHSKKESKTFEARCQNQHKASTKTLTEKDSSVEISSHDETTGKQSCLRKITNSLAATAQNNVTTPQNKTRSKSRTLSDNATPRTSSRSRLSTPVHTPRSGVGSPFTTPRSSGVRGKGSTGKKQVPGPNKRNAIGETPLQVACIKGDLKHVEELVKAGAMVNTRDNAGWTPLHEACHHGHLQVASYLLENGALIDVPGPDNLTPLHDAIAEGKLECVKLLMSCGASTTAREIHGHTPVDYAVTSEMKEALKTKVDPSKVHADQEVLDVLDYQQPCLLATALTREQKLILHKCCAAIQGRLVEEFCPEVTHVVTSTNQNGMCPRTIKYIEGVLTGKWIVSFEWVTTCLEYNMRVSEEAFEITGTSSTPDSFAPSKGRINRKQQLPGLFVGCQFYFLGSFENSTIEKSNLQSLVKLGGGTILNREPKPGHVDPTTLTVPYYAPLSGPYAKCCIFIVHENGAPVNKLRTENICTVPACWIMHSASVLKLVDPDEAKQ